MADIRANPHLNAVMRKGTGNRFNGFPEGAGRPKPKPKKQKEAKKK